MWLKIYVSLIIVGYDAETKVRNNKNYFILVIFKLYFFILLFVAIKTRLPETSMLLSVLEVYILCFFPRALYARHQQIHS